MNKSLAERIGEHTRQVVEAREKEQRERIKAIMLEFLEKEIRKKAENGKNLFRFSNKNELDIELSVVMSEEEKEMALSDIGFKINKYPMCSFLTVPETGRVSEEIKRLFGIYDESLKKYMGREEQKAYSDCKAVVEKLEKEEYEVNGIGSVAVEIKSKSNTEHYKTYVRKKMKSEGFEVEVFPGEWHISIIQEEGD